LCGFSEKRIGTLLFLQAHKVSSHRGMLGGETSGDRIMKKNYFYIIFTNLQKIKQFPILQNYTTAAISNGGWPLLPFEKAGGCPPVPR
jgi:hypothetical protein